MIPRWWFNEGVYIIEMQGWTDGGAVLNGFIFHFHHDAAASGCKALQRWYIMAEVGRPEDWYRKTVRNIRNIGKYTFSAFMKLKKTMSSPKLRGHTKCDLFGVAL